VTVTEPEALEATVDWLLSIPNSDFEDLVNNEMRSTPDRPRVKPHLSAGLRDPRVLRRWYATILTMHKSVEGQFSAKTADNSAMIKKLQSQGAPRAQILREQSSFEQWRAGALRVKNGLEIRLIEAKYLLELNGDSYITDRTAEERNSALGRVGVLEDAIRRHMDACLKVAPGASSDDIDEALWAYVRENP
jgi:hypothetical protein